MRKAVKPDDYFRKGPFEMARFGKQTVFRSNWDEKSHAKYLQKLRERLPAAQEEISGLIEEAAQQVLRLPPSELLYRAYWLMASQHVGMASESEGTDESIKSVRILEFIQNVIVSRAPSRAIEAEVSEEDLDHLAELIGEIYDKINLDFMLCYKATSRADSEVEKEVEDIRDEAITHWVNVRGDRYLVHEREHFEDLLGGQSQLLSEALGVSSKQIVEGFSAIIDSLTYGIGNAMSEMRELMTKVDPIFLTRASKVNPKTDEEARELMSEVIEAEGLGEEMARIQSRAFGMALFDLGQVTDLPSSFLKALSWGLGEESSFFSGNEFAGWPTRATPISKRPFITIGGKHYCFCIYALCDHFYRTVEKMVRKAKPDSVDSWNQNQTEITEELPLKYLRKILPKSDSFKSVYYRWYPKEGHPKREWCEVDGLFLVEDHLIVIEVKAPAFSSQSPFDRFDTHADSVRKLVGDPIRQGARFVEYLKHQDEVQIYDADHKPVGCLNQAAFRKITICAMSIDPMTEIASKAHRLKPLGIDTGDLPVWAISLDDLRVCSEVFTHPLVFLHFLEKRTKASQEMNVELNDELDHIGLYFEHNDYTLHASEMTRGLDHLRFIGYRASIDEFFSRKLLKPEITSPFAQEVPPIYTEIFEFLANSKMKNTCEISSFLLDLAGDARKGVQQLVDTTLERQASVRRVNYGAMNGEVDLTIGCWQPHLFIPEKEHFVDHSKTELLMSGSEGRMLLQLTFSRDSKLENVEWKQIYAKDILDSEKASYLPKIEELKARRLNRSLSEKGKPGRNEQCPCGSGRKFKKCCL